jgi:hypothetical protein
MSVLSERILVTERPQGSRAPMGFGGAAPEEMKG